MAIQHGINPFTGKLGNVVGRRLHGKFIYSEISGLTSENLRNLNDHRFNRCRETATEFGKCSLTTNAIYNTIDRKKFANHLHGKANNKLMGYFIDSLKYDRTNIDGRRQPNEISMQQLIGFQFNPPAASTIKEKVKISETDENTLKLNLEFGQKQFDWPDNAQAVHLFFYTVQLDFEKIVAQNSMYFSDELHKDEITPKLEIELLTAEGNCLLIIGLQFMEEVNGEYYLLSNKIQSPLYVAHYRKESA